jgi:hypothetical protein
MAAERKFGRLVYLASPYSHADKAVEAKRHQDAVAAWRWLIANRKEWHIFSPIALCHQLSLSEEGLPGDWKFWADFDGTMVRKCDEFWVLCIPGFRESVGVTAERKIAGEIGIPVRFMIPAAGGYEFSDSEPQ